jgi:hypothetical protein
MPLFVWGVHATAWVQVVVKPRYDKAWPFSEGLRRVLDGRKYGFVDKAGKEVSPPRFTGAGDFSHGLATVKVGKRHGVIDEKGRYVRKPAACPSLP